MPVHRGKTNIGRNIAEMRKAGHPYDQAVAASMRMARRGYADGGAPEHFVQRWLRQAEIDAALNAYPPPLTSARNLIRHADEDEVGAVHGGMRLENTYGNRIDTPAGLLQGSGRSLSSVNNFGPLTAEQRAALMKDAVRDAPSPADYLVPAARQQMRELEGGPLLSREDLRGRYRRGGVVGGLDTPTPGRTDSLAIDVPNGAYVLPADVVSGIGKGNTKAGMSTLDQIFKSAPYDVRKGDGPYGIKMPSALSGRSKGIPKPKAPRIPKFRFARGGAVPIAAAGGEYVVSPEAVAMIGDGSLDRGHAVLDRMVEVIRGETINSLSTLPPPKR